MLYELPPPARGGSALFARINTAAFDHVALASLVWELVMLVGPKPGDVGPTGRKPFYTPKASS
uniref:Uncharacterized protein n=1 Tax=Oryza rufipogon TaxID=4529 RepID=A0A0E0P6G4_ORYRU